LIKLKYNKFISPYKNGSLQISRRAMEEEIIWCYVLHLKT